MRDPSRVLGSLRRHRPAALRSNLALCLILILLVGCLDLQPVPPPRPNSITPTTEPVSITDWQTFTSQEYGFEFKYPPQNQIESEIHPGTTGFLFCLKFRRSVTWWFDFVDTAQAGGPEWRANDLVAGGTSKDYSYPTEGDFLDTQGFVNKGGQFFYRVTPRKQALIEKELIKQVRTNPNQVQFLIIEGEPQGVDPIIPGENRIGALVNLKHPVLTGLGFLYPKHSTLLTVAEFFKVLLTFKYLQ